MGRAIREQYRDRSLFLHRSLKSARVDELVKDVSQLSDNDFDWAIEGLGISRDALKRIESKGIRKTTVFCHPGVLCERPELISYYRNIVGLTQKGLSKLAVHTSSYERGVHTSLGEHRALTISNAVNNLMCSILLSDDSFADNDVLRNLVASLGITLDGSWRNKVGEKATREVRSLFHSYLKERGFLKKSTSASLTLAGGTVVRFSSDPDVAILGDDKKLKVAIEVKGGIDEAGALERYGAAKKSFDKARKQNVRVHTIYLASCITQTVRQNIEVDGLVSEIQDLLEVLSNPKKARQFLDDLFEHIVRVKKDPDGHID